MADELAEHWEELVDLAWVALIRVDGPTHQPGIGQLVAGVALDVAGRLSLKVANLATLPGSVT